MLTRPLDENVSVLRRLLGAERLAVAAERDAVRTSVDANVLLVRGDAAQVTKPQAGLEIADVLSDSDVAVRTRVDLDTAHLASPRSPKRASFSGYR